MLPLHSGIFAKAINKFQLTLSKTFCPHSTTHLKHRDN